MESARERAIRIGDKIRDARGRQGMSQSQLAALIAERTGLEPESARRSLVNHEGGRFAPRRRTLEIIAEVTGQPLEFFVGTPEVGPGQRFQD